MTLEQGREVMAIPGSIDRPTSAGPNQLIKDGAHPVTESADILALLWPQQPSRRGESSEVFAATLAEPARTVWLALSDEPRHVDDLAGVVGLTAGELPLFCCTWSFRGCRTTPRSPLSAPSWPRRHPIGERLRERVLAIVTLIAQYFLEEQEPKSEHDLVEELLAIGFGAEEIDAAFLWLEDETLRPAATDEFAAPLLSHRSLLTMKSGLSAVRPAAF